MARYSSIRPNAAASAASVAPPIAISVSPGSARSRSISSPRPPVARRAIALHRRQRRREHHLWERLPKRGPLELRVVERSILVGGLPVQHRLVQPSSQQVDVDLSNLVDPEAKDLFDRRRPVEAAVRPDDEAVK